jgi:hypothetical protein
VLIVEALPGIFSARRSQDSIRLSITRKRYKTLRNTSAEMDHTLNQFLDRENLFSSPNTFSDNSRDGCN